MCLGWLRQLLRKTSSKPGIGEFAPGSVLGGRYEILEKLGEGGFGIVYHIRDRGLRDFPGRDHFALKTVNARLAANRAARELFNREANLWVQLGVHDHIVMAHSVQELHGRLCVLMDYIQPDNGGRVTLADHLKGPIDSRMAATWSLQFCQAMEHAIRYGLIAHRDIKPANLMITRQLMLMVTDFGIAEANTQDGSLAGTYGYIAPELFDGGAAGVATDVYSFGVTLWQMVHGRELPAEYQQAALERRRPPELLARHGTFEAILSQCLQVDPAHRYQSFERLRHDIEALWPSAGAAVAHIYPRTAELDQSAGHWSARAASLTTLGRHDEALKSVDVALSIDPDDPGAVVNKSLILLRLGRMSEAEALSRRGVELDPQSPVAWNARGMTHNAQGNFTEAITCFERAIASQDTPPDYIAGLWHNKAFSEHHLGKYPAALLSCDRGLELDPQSPLIWTMKGQCLSRLGRSDEAISCYRKALEINADYVAAWNDLGNEYQRRHAPEAEGCYRQAITLDPRHQRAWYNLGQLLYFRGEYRDAIAAYGKAIEIDPRDCDTLHAMGAALGHLGSLEEALGYFDRAIDVNPDNPGTHANRALSLCYLGRSAEAGEACRRALQLDPRNQQAAEILRLVEEGRCPPR